MSAHAERVRQAWARNLAGVGSEEQEVAALAWVILHRDERAIVLLALERQAKDVDGAPKTAETLREIASKLARAHETLIDAEGVLG